MPTVGSVIFRRKLARYRARRLTELQALAHSAAIKEAVRLRAPREPIARKPAASEIAARIMERIRQERKRA